jgi:hypothetical protein
MNTITVYNDDINRIKRGDTITDNNGNTAVEVTSVSRNGKVLTVNGAGLT